jgi:predicted MFS family arabinose efflux permease
MFDFSLLRSATFFVVCMSGVLAFMGIYTPFVYVTAKALTFEGVSRSKASLIISVLGICNTAGRLVAGWLADRSWADSLLIHNVAVIIAGLLTCLVPALNSYELLCAYAALFGISLAAFVALRSIVIVELLGIQKLTNAFGLTSLFQGIAVLIGSPLSGALLEATGSFTAPFIVSGSMLVLGGLICLPARRLAAWEAKKSEAKNKKLAEAAKA